MKENNNLFVKQRRWRTKDDERILPLTIIIIYNFCSYQDQKKLKFFKMNNLIKLHTQYCTDQSLSQSSTTKDYIINIAKQLHTFLLSLPLCRDHYRDLTQQEHEILSASKRDPSIHSLFTLMLAIDSGIRKYVEFINSNQKQIWNSVKQFQRICFKKPNGIKDGESMRRMQLGYKNLQNKINKLNNVLIEGEKSSNSKILEYENKSLKQKVYSMEKHLREISKGKKPDRIINEDDYGFKRGESKEIPLKVSVEILQRKLRELEKENAILAQNQAVNYKAVIESLETEIKYLKLQKIKNDKLFDSIQKSIGITGNYERGDNYDSYYHVSPNYGVKRSGIQKLNYPLNDQSELNLYGKNELRYRNQEEEWRNSYSPISRKRQKSMPIRIKQGYYI